jgi:tetratricopeptide (TPR) repeat protein
MSLIKSFPGLLVGVCFLSAGPALAAQEPAHHHEATEQLGKVSFPVSCEPVSQKPFERGVALLHSFGYEEAEEQFVELTKQDPNCAMAHWGIAMSFFHQIWDRPQESTRKRGHEEMEKAQAIGAPTGRERGYISAMAIFYRDPASEDYMKRATAYSDAMGQLYNQYPKDLEAGAFYALSLLAAEPPGDTSLAAEKKAVAVLIPLFEQQPDYPGLAHYIIHACDSPQMAPSALEAARRYAEIAPSSAHAVHMPSHIFARLGLWQEDIQANLKSVALIEQSGGPMYMHGHALHAMHFLLYAYLQTGQDKAAKQELLQSEKILAMAPKDGDDSGMLEYFGYAGAHFPALYDLEMRHWTEAAALQPAPGASPHLQMITWWARTIASAHRGDLEATRDNVQKYDEAREAVRKTKYAYFLDGPQIARDEVHAWLAFAEKKNEDALRQMRQAADTQDQVGKAEVDMPAREMLADMLLELNQPEIALIEYERSMKIDPNRFNTLAGAAKAAALAHQPAKADTYSAQLLKNCDDGKHSNRPELSDAKMLLARESH